ncbi:MULTISPECIES: hypothetical protein [unclassified Mesorhizobium]|uniref:hypothetical protein n=1 Tax=unclassified Mesorhizobium TaxID=325217 RepID=UPI00112CDF37|nr:MULTISPECIES: hypothetical protein [unclassified Mesorhizobium]TPL05100.1 hypothetical protein FJ567_01935 [Mesorhizobium sp. B2-4-16]TPL74473.1 hypothetical protein FJ956_07420 [Mesorhizobium sp. B2-4-3]
MKISLFCMTALLLSTDLAAAFDCLGADGCSTGSSGYPFTVFVGVLFVLALIARAVAYFRQGRK